MQKSIKLLQIRNEELNRLRIARAIQNSSDSFRHVFELIPLLLHVNQHGMPGYVINAPCGIAKFQLSPYQSEFLNQQYSHLLNLLNNQAHNTQNIIAKNAIIGVYSIGSVSSIAQTPISDLDIWICIEEHLSEYEKNRLSQKSLAIKTWANSLGIMVNFYLVNQDQFQNPVQSDSLSQEHCGSSQHLLLLDEFYRSSIRLAGKPLLWMHVPVSNEQDYSSCVTQLIKDNIINPADWLDLGGFANLRASEFFGASLWQIYTCIDNPFKAAIKIILLESYAAYYPQINLLASEFKQLLLNNPNVKDYADSYLLTLERVDDYLSGKNKFELLDLVRRCCYLKAKEGYTSVTDITTWKAKELLKLERLSKWNNKDLEHLNRRPSWKIDEVQYAYNVILNTLMASYKRLVNFSRIYNVEASIMPQDLSMLARKLYAAFEELPSKVKLINLNFSLDISEEHLTFIQVTKHKTLKTGWYLINRKPNLNDLLNKRHVEYHNSLTHLVAWAYFNGLLTPNTNLHLFSQQIDIETLQQFITDMRSQFAVKLPPPPDEDFNRPCNIRQLCVFINLKQINPSQEKKNKKQNIRTEILHTELLNLGPNEHNLINSIDLVYRNLWNEVKTLHFAGEHAILQMLKIISNKMHHSVILPDIINVFCYSKNDDLILKTKVEELVKKCINSDIGTVFKKEYIDSIPGTNNIINLYLQEITNANEEKNIHNNLTLHTSTINGQNKQRIKYKKNAARTTITPSISHEIDAFANEGFIQFFFEDTQDAFNMYILNEKNDCKVLYDCKSKKDYIIKNIYKIFTSSNNKIYHASQPGKTFNFPQFYQLIKHKNKVQAVPFNCNQHVKNIRRR